jgi:hypothetical protein
LLCTIVCNKWKQSKSIIILKFIRKTDIMHTLEKSEVHLIVHTSLLCVGWCKARLSMCVENIPCSKLKTAKSKPNCSWPKKFAHQEKTYELWNNLQHTCPWSSFLVPGAQVNLQFLLQRVVSTIAVSPSTLAVNHQSHATGVLWMDRWIMCSMSERQKKIIYLH